MRKVVFMLLAITTLTTSAKPKIRQVIEIWPVMDAWFKDTTNVDISILGRQYVLTDYGVVVGSLEIQAIIDRCDKEGGGIVVVPAGTFKTGALFFRQGIHQHVGECGTLLGPDHIIILRNCHVVSANWVLWLKMRPDTPQNYALTFPISRGAKPADILKIYL